MQQTKKFKMADAISPYLAVSCGLKTVSWNQTSPFSVPCIDSWYKTFDSFSSLEMKCYFKWFDILPMISKIKVVLSDTCFYMLWTRFPLCVSFTVDGWHIQELFFFFFKLCYLLCHPITADVGTYILISYTMETITYRKNSNIRHTLLGNKIVNHSDVVGASPPGAARRDEKHLKFVIWCLLY